SAPRDPYAFFFTIPTIKGSSAPTTAERPSSVPVPPLRALLASCPPPTPPRAPRIVLIRGPRLLALLASPATFPPTAPAMSWRSTLVRSMVCSSSGEDLRDGRGEG